MRGGNNGGIRKRYVRRVAFAALAGILGALGSGTTIPRAWATESATDDNCARQSRNEKSILVASSKTAMSAIADSEKQAADSLEPIANVSEHVPDLADPRAIGLTPDLAEPREIDPESGPVLTVHPDHGAPGPVASESSASESGSAVSQEAVALSFHGIVPGVSNRIDVLREWGDPRTEDTMGETLRYRFDKLRSVRVKFAEEIVDAVVVELDAPLSTEALVSKLELTPVQPALLADDAGDPLALAFPERGIVMRYAGEGQVGEIVIQPVKAAGFLLRAESLAKSNLSSCRRDLERALDLDRTSAHTRDLLSKYHLKVGEAVTAERYAAEALEIEPKNDAYRLQHARCLRQLARNDLAVDETRKVLESSGNGTLTRAQALYEMSQLASLGSNAVAQRAVLLLTKSIDIADRLAVGSDYRVKQQAKELLVETHLAMAVEIARGEWAREDQTIPQWIERASALSEEMIATDVSNLPYRLDVAVSALAAAASLETPIDPLLWIEEAEETAELLSNSTEDLETRAQYDWQLGLAYFHAAQVQHRRSEPESAERLGKLAMTKLGELSKRRGELPDTAYLMGRLYFQIGAIHAVHHNDHAIACQWYDRSLEYLLYPMPVTTMAAPQQHGDALVSMGVSFWHVKRREDAIDATQAGVELIEHAVQEGLLSADSLVVPYGNLAAMYEAQGEAEQATKYARLAKNVTDSKVTSKPTPNQRG